MNVREMAEAYVELLTVGSEIVEDTDGPVIAPFRHLVAALLFKRGLYLESTARGQIVTDRAPWKTDNGTPVSEMKIPISCVLCGASWFTCEHGVAAVVVVGGYREPLLPVFVQRERAVG